ncbi:type I toxin-antitoxin system toxin Ldr family protein [Kluyvera cryocrescens]
MNFSNSRIAANRCHCNQGGYMSLTEVCIIVWHDLAAPTLASIAAGLFLGWWHSRR